MPNYLIDRNSTWRLLWQILFVANTAFILWYWWQGSGDSLMAGGSALIIALGRLSGLAAAWTVLLQFFFMSRTPWLERVFGLDKLARVHHLSGQWSLVFLLSHPLLLTVGYSRLSGVSLIHQFIAFFVGYQHVWLAVIGWLLFIVVVALSLMIVRRRLRYESWYFVHLLVYGAVGTSFWHQIAVGPDILSHRLFYEYWIGLYVVVLSMHLGFRFVRPLALAGKHRFAVSRVVRENHNTISVYITGRHLSEFNIHPGQFMILRFLDRRRWWQAHPFSLSRVPDGQQLRITIRELGDFTRSIGALAVGTNILIDGPYGVFTAWVSVAPKVLFIAGGIGITPVRSLMEHMLAAGKSAVLLYGNKTSEDIVFGQELGQLEQQYGIRVINVLSNDPHFAGERGYIDAEKIKRLVPDVTERDVYMCGPPPMLTALLAALRRLGLPPARLHYEKFSLP